MARFDLADNAMFPQLAERIIEVSGPLAPMWPSFWIKAAAVRDGATWHLCQFYMVGRWSDREPTRQRRDKGDAIALVNYQVTASEAWNKLTTLAESGQVTLLPGVEATAPSITIPNAGSYWNEPVHYPPSGIADVSEQALWRYLHVGYSSQWLSNDLDMQTRLLRAMQPDLDQRNARSFEALLASRFNADPNQAHQYALGMFGYVFDLPLALFVEHGALDRQANRLQLSVRCRPPLTVDTLEVTLGEHWSSDAEPVPLEPEVEAPDGWSIAVTTVPYDCGGVCLGAPLLGARLSDEIVAPSAAEDAHRAASYLYVKASSEPLSAGEGRWKRDLFNSKKGTRFEVALANALTRLGIPVLFGGQVEKDGEVGGPATPGIDLVAMDPSMRRATAISLKATVGSPSDDELQKLQEGASGLAQALPNWTAFGILACRAPAARLARFASLTDVRVWGCEDLEAVYTAEKAEAIYHLLWLPPGIPFSESWQYVLGYLGRARR